MQQLLLTPPRPRTPFAKLVLCQPLGPPYMDHCITAYDRAGTSNLVRPPLAAGTVKLWGATRFGAAKLLDAFRSSPVSNEPDMTRPGAVSSQTISTSCDFDKSRFRMNRDSFPFSRFSDPATSMYAT